MMVFLQSLQDFWNYSFLFYALIGTVFLSITSGILSPIIVVKKYSFLGASVGHSTLLGVALTHLLLGPELGQELSHYLLTLCFILVMVTFLAKGTYRQALPSDSFIGVFYSITMALGVVIFSFTSDGQTSLMSYLFGNILLLSQQDVILLFFLLAVVSSYVFVPFKKHLYILHDPQGAIIKGLPTQFFHYTLYYLLTVLIVTSIKLAGTILVSTMLLIPGLVGLKYGTSPRQTFFLSILFSLISSVMGLILSNTFEIPSGATMALCQFLGLFLCKLFFATKR